MKTRYALFTIILIFSTSVFSFSSETVTKLIKEGDSLYYKRTSVVNLEASYEKYEQALEIAPENADIYWRIARYYYNKGMNATVKESKMNFFVNVQEWSQKGIAVDNNNLECHYWYAVGMGKYGDTKGVLKSLSLVNPIKDECNLIIKRDPNHAGANHVLGVMYRKLPGFAGGSLELSLKHLKIAVQNEPTDTIHYLELANTYIAMDEKEKAKENLNILINIKYPEDPVQANEDRKEARKLLEKL